MDFADTFLATFGVAVIKIGENDSEDKTIRGSGVYRITDSNGDGELNDVQMLLRLKVQNVTDP